MTRRAFAWLLLLGAPGLAAGLVVTTLELAPSRRAIEDLAGYVGLVLAAVGPGIGVTLLTRHAGRAVSAVAVTASAIAGALAYLFTGGVIVTLIGNR